MGEPQERLDAAKQRVVVQPCGDAGARRGARGEREQGDVVPGAAVVLVPGDEDDSGPVLVLRRQVDASYPGLQEVVATAGTAVVHVVDDVRDDQREVVQPAAGERGCQVAQPHLLVDAGRADGRVVRGGGVPDGVEVGGSGVARARHALRVDPPAWAELAEDAGVEAATGRAWAAVGAADPPR